MKRHSFGNLLAFALLLLIVLSSLSLSACSRQKEVFSTYSAMQVDNNTEIENSVPEITEAESEAPDKEALPDSTPALVSSAAAVVSETPPPVQITYNYQLKVNRSQNIVTVYSKDDSGNFTVPEKAMVCSVGLNFQTPTGTFTTKNKYTWRSLVGGVYGQYATRITGSILFHSVPYFSKNKGDLEYEQYNLLGSAASLGCVRLSVADAKWIYDNCPLGTTVIIYDSDAPEPLPKPTPIKIDINNQCRGWDPTDPDIANPWRAIQDTTENTDSSNSDN